MQTGKGRQETKNPGKKARASQQQRQTKIQLLLWLALGSVLLIGAAVLILLGGKEESKPKVPVEANGRPSLKVDREVLDFGEVNFNKPVTATFLLSNVGDQPLRFTKAPYIEVVEGC